MPPRMRMAASTSVERPAGVATGHLGTTLQRVRRDHHLTGDVDTGLIAEQVEPVGQFAQPRRPLRGRAKRPPAPLGRRGRGCREQAELSLQLEQLSGRRGVQTGRVRAAGHDLLDVAHVTHDG